MMQFLELFSLARLPDASVADHLSFQGSTCQWDIVFTRAV